MSSKHTDKPKPHTQAMLWTLWERQAQRTPHKGPVRLALKVKPISMASTRALAEKPARPALSQNCLWPRIL